MTARASSDPWTAAARGLRAAWPGVIVGEAAGVHRARVATRRLREALPVLDADRRASRRLRRQLRALTRALGPVRELDVTLGLVVRMLHDEPDLDAALETMRVSLMERRQRRRARLLRRVEQADIAGLVARLRSLAADGTPSARTLPLDRPQIQRRMARRAARLDRAVDRAGALYAPEALHRVRIAVKKLRYAVELGRAARIRGAAGGAARLSRVQDLLGEWHDWQVLSTHATRIQGAMALDDDHLADFAALSTRIEDRCRALHAAFLSTRPSLLALTAAIAGAGRPAGSSVRQP